MIQSSPIFYFDPPITSGGIPLKEIICLANEPWSQTPERTQQLLSRIRDVNILYFVPPHASHDLSWKKSGRKVKPNIIVYALPPNLISEVFFPSIYPLGEKRLGRFIAQKARKHHFRAPLLWLTCPKQLHLLNELSYRSLVYDRCQEWEDLPAAWEERLAQQADVVFTVSPQLKEQLAPFSSNIAIVPNGVNFPLFSGQNNTKVHPRVVGLSDPVLGWSGTIYEDLDLSPLLYATQTCPRWTFLLIGSKSEHNPWLSRLSRCKNVVLIPPCSLMEVPEYLSKCSVLLNFLRTSQSCDDVIPRRIYEYLSTGKPVVSMLWPDQVEYFPDVIYGANSPEEFVHLCAQALEEDPRWLSQRRRNHGAAASWTNRAAEVSRILSVSGLL